MRAWMLVLSSLLCTGCLLDRSGTSTFVLPGPDGGIHDAATHPDAGDARPPADAAPIMDAPPEEDAMLADAALPDPDAGPPDAGDLPDAGPEDAGAADASFPDAAEPDGGPPDGGPMDAGAPDAGPPDASVPDAGTDAGRPDAGPTDASLPDAGTDAGTDAGPPDGCADGTVDQTYPGRMDMVGCNGTETQCTAAILCQAGWRLCSWSEYRARGGDVMAADARRWIAGCARSGCGDLTADPPADGICGACTGMGAATLTLQYDCPSGGPTETVACHVGIVADTGSRRIGTPAESCAMGSIARTDGLSGATCCR